MGETPVTGVFWNPSSDDEPSSDIAEIAASRKLSSVLDVGCGNGRNLVPFVDQDSSLHAIDLDPEAVRATAQRFLDVDPRRFRVTVADVRSFSPGRRFDLVVCHGVLHFLGRWDRRQAYERLASWVAPGGLVSIVAFNRRMPIPDDLVALMPDPAADSSEMLDAFAGWERITFRSYDYRDEHCGGTIRHMHAIDRLVARAPAADHA